MPAKKDNISFNCEKSESENTRYEIVKGKVRYTDKIIETEIEGFIENLQKGASVEIENDSYGIWSPFDYLLRTLRPTLSVETLSKNGEDNIVLMWGAGMKLEQRMNIFSILVEKLRIEALKQYKKTSKKNFHIIKYMRAIFEINIHKIISDAEKQK